MLIRGLKFGLKVVVVVTMLFIDFFWGTAESYEEDFERIKRKWHEDGVLTGDAPG